MGGAGEERKDKAIPDLSLEGVSCAPRDPRHTSLWQRPGIPHKCCHKGEGAKSNEYVICIRVDVLHRGSLHAQPLDLQICSGNTRLNRKF